MEIGVYRKLVETEEDRLGIDYREDTGIHKDRESSVASILVRLGHVDKVAFKSSSWIKNCHKKKH